MMSLKEKPWPKLAAPVAYGSAPMSCERRFSGSPSTS